LFANCRLIDSSSRYDIDFSHRHSLKSLTSIPGFRYDPSAGTIRHDAELQGVYLIAISGYAQDEDKEKAGHAGFDEYFIKPVDLKHLSTLIQNRFSSAVGG
jgi:hypothetical protein